VEAKAIHLQVCIGVVRFLAAVQIIAYVSIDVAAKTKDSKMHVSCLSNITKRKQQDCLCLIQQSFYYFSDE